MRPADLKGPLPTGTTVLEASAGTGKTYTIAGLVARYVAEGVARIDQLLVVTFGRAATSELRTRVRARLVTVRQGLVAGGSDDPVVELLLEQDVPLAVRRLSEALAAFDSATVATTHEFCFQVLRSLGVLADHEPTTRLVESVRDLVSEVADDLYLRASAFAKPSFERKAAQVIAAAAVADPTARLLPETPAAGSPSEVRVRFCEAVRREVDVRKRTLGILSFDDLLGRVAASLEDEEAVRRLRARYRVVLVDEFQDTDPLQWKVLKRAFHGQPDLDLVVIGDPKQAIYAFRGADVHAYLDAAAESEKQTLDTNWRSDPPVVDGIAQLLRDAALGHPEIAVTRVRPGYPTPALTPVDPRPVRLRVLTSAGLATNKSGRVPTDDAVRVIAEDVADQVVNLLEVEKPRFTPRDQDEDRAVVAGDIAVLVHRGAQAEAVRKALLARGVPVVLTGTTSVFLSDAATDWTVLLEALEQPHRSGRVRRFALTAFIGAHHAEIDDALSDALGQRLRGWAEVLTERGVAGLFAVLAADESLVERLLGSRDGERVLTDLRHVAEILHRQGIEAELGLSGLVSWLHQRRTEASADGSTERSRRLDTDRSAVQVMTVWVSKGLQFPVVMAPFEWHWGKTSAERTPRGYDHGRTLFVGGSADPGYKAACAAEDVEEAGEHLRLLYVAMTRAVSRLVVWWAPTHNTGKSALHRLLFASDVKALAGDLRFGAGPDCHDRLKQLATGAVSFALVGAPTTLEMELPTVPPSSLDVARFSRSIDRSWRRTSYTGLTSGAGHGVGSEPDEPVKDDEPEVIQADQGAGTPSLWHDLPGGPGFGTVVHRILERADLAADWHPVVAEELARGAWSVEPEVLVGALEAAIRTPVVAGQTLLTIPWSDQLRELDFELPLAGGDRSGSPVKLSGLAALLRALPDHDPVRAFAAVLAGPLGDQLLRGYLAGSIDVVLRVDGRYWVVDHKTNRLAARDVPLTSWFYRKEALDVAMLEAGYPLQALLYTVALHRYLRWRLPDYDPALHLGGVRYLFLRGMVGGAEGVWSWDPPVSLIESVSDFLAGSST